MYIILAWVSVCIILRNFTLQSRLISTDMWRSETKAFIMIVIGRFWSQPIQM